MSTHAAAMYRRPGVVEVIQRPVPEPGPDEVLVEVAYCGVCGTDLHLMGEGWSRPDVVLGHEWSGTVAATGAGVDEWGIGDRVVGYPHRPCGTCAACRRGRASLCSRRPMAGSGLGHDGAFAELLVVPARHLVSIPDEVDLRTAALTEPLAVAAHAVARAELDEGASALVLGAGPIGAAIITLLVATDHPVEAVEPHAERARLAEQLGAQRVRAAGELVVPTVAEPDRIVPDAVPVVFECSGKGAAASAGLAQLLPAGRLVLVGSGIEGPSWDPNRILLNELVITGAFNYEPAGFEAVLTTLADRVLPTEILADDVDFPLEDLGRVLTRLRDGSIAGKALIRPGHRPPHERTML